MLESESGFQNCWSRSRESVFQNCWSRFFKTAGVGVRSRNPKKSSDSTTLVSSELVHYNHKVLAIYTHWQAHWHTHTLPHQQSDGNWALMLWKDDGNTLTVAHTAHVTWVRHYVTHHTLLRHLSLRLARIKVNFTYFSLIKVNICQTVGVKHILNYK